MMCLLFFVLSSVVWCVCSSQGLFRIESSKSKHELLRAGLQQRGWRELRHSRTVEPGFLWTFRWSGAAPARTVVNHFANHAALSSKSGLLAALSPHSAAPRAHLAPKDIPLIAADFHRTAAACAAARAPPAHMMQDKTQEQQMLLLPDLQPDIDCGEAHGKLWIAKPAAGTRGVGIEVFQDLQAMEEFLQKQEGEFVVQKYIESPLLLFDRKVRLWGFNFFFFRFQFFF